MLLMKQACNHQEGEKLSDSFFLGMNQIEAAEAVGISERTARRDLVFAQAWLARILKGE